MPLPAMLPISLIHPTGNPNAREAAIALAEARLLHEVITTIAYNPQSAVARALNQIPAPFGPAIHRQLQRRTWVPPQPARIQCHPWREGLRVGLTRSGLVSQLGIRPQRLVDWIYTSLDWHVAKHHLQGVRAVYGYEDGAAATFAAAKQQGILCLYDLPIPFYQTVAKLHREESSRFPELSASLTAIHEPTWKLERKETEVRLADRIFVASQITQQSLLAEGIDRDKITVIPYGAPLEYFQPQPQPNHPFRVLYVGRVAPHKGVHYLLQAWQELQLPGAELVLVGVNDFPKHWLSRYQDSFQYVPSVPHAELNAYYSSASVLVLPSLIEGFGMVVLEAMACGIPAITTMNVGSADCLTSGETGFVLPIRDVEALKAKLEWCYRHPQQLREMGQAAWHKAQQLTWEAYRQTLSACVREMVQS